MKRGAYSTEAIVLGSTDYGESDRILTLCTREYGKLKGIAKGARRSTRRFVGKLDPLSHIRIIFFESGKGELVRVDDATLINGFDRLKCDIETLSRAQYLLELTSEMTREGQPTTAFDLLCGFLRLFACEMSEAHEADRVARFFEINLLRALGYMPKLDACVTCSRAFATDEPKRGFCPERGGLLCNACRGGAVIMSLSAGTASTLMAATRLDVDKLGRLKAANGFVEESDRALGAFLRHIIGKELKTKKFMDKLTRSPLATGPLPGKGLLEA